MTKKQVLPTIFVSHGAPTLPIEEVPAREFLKVLGSQFNKVKAVLFISAHWATSIPTVNAPEWPETIHNFYGFPEELYEMEYPAQVDLDLAEHVADVIQAADLQCHIDGQRGLDHGARVPLMLMFPKADIPVVQLSIQQKIDPSRHLEVGRAI